MRTSPRGAVLATVLLLGAACGTDEVGPAGDAAGDVGAEGPADEERSRDAAGDEVREEPHVAVSRSDLGDILVDDRGMTLYLFTEDDDGQSVCVDACAAAWPPLLVEVPPVAGEDVDASLLDTIERDDGSTQVRYAGWPLYTWAQDQQPGDLTGQGVQEVWFVVSPEGEPVRNDDERSSTGHGGY
jgi:predicted lipoprotein with Yx(FWY)xxD motif